MQFRLVHLIAGSLVIVLGLIAAGIGIWKNFHPQSRATVPYLLVTDGNVIGVRPGSPVFLKGVLVGGVRSVGFDSRNPRFIHIRITVLPGVRLYKGTYAEIAALGVASDLNVIDLYNSGNHKERLITTPEHPAVIAIRPPPADPMAVQARQAMQGMDMATQQAKQVLNPDNRMHLQHLQEQLQTMTAQARQMQRQWRSTAKAMPPLGDQVKVTLMQAKRLSENARAAAEAVRQSNQVFSKNVVTVTKQLRIDQKMLQTQWRETLSPDYQTALDSTAQAMLDMRGLANEIRASPGSLVLGKPGAGADPGEPGFTPGAKPGQHNER